MTTNDILTDLFKQHECFTIHAYYDIIIDLTIRGEKMQAKEKFNLLPRVNQKDFVKQLFFGNISNIYLQKTDKEMFFDLIK